MIMMNIKNSKIKVKNMEWYNVKNFCAILDRWGCIKYNPKNGKVSYQGKTTIIRHKNEITYLINNSSKIRDFFKKHNGLIESTEKVDIDYFYKNDVYEIATGNVK
jgi:hypothetical protein